MKKENTVIYINNKLAVIHNPKMVTKLNGLFACATFDKIYVDDNFLKLTETAQEAIYYHEKAHIEFGHSYGYYNDDENPKDRNKLAKKGFIRPEERLADAYANKKTNGMMLFALGEMNTYFIDRKMDNTEICLRMSKLMR